MSYSVTLDGKVCVLKYTMDDRELVEATFPRPDGTPGSMGSMARENLIQSGSFKVQTMLVWTGVRHLGKSWTFDRVRESMGKATQNGGMGEILQPALKAILASGVLGRIVEEAPEPVPEEESAASGKAPTEPGSTG